MRLIEAVVPSRKFDEVKAAVEEFKPTHFRFSSTEENETCVLRAFFVEDGAQALLDRLQEICDGDKDDWRILVLPVEATAPQPEDNENDVGSDEEIKRKRKLALREEIFNDVSEGAELHSDFYVLTLASTIVAAIGLNADNVAAVIGAMVIAPLLGPILAVSFAAALGDFKLLARAGRNAVTGLALGMFVAALMGLWLDINFESTELMSRTVAGLDSVALGLAAGAAAALSIVTGVSAALVGVMVAVALLPPAAAAGLFLGAGEIDLFWRAMLLLSV
ncbi:MAG: TIGR00341 family protein, partial [Marinicaulis sp.]|nr:TIGR00341 family protein [Marinicaulis sp.]